MASGQLIQSGRIFPARSRVLGSEDRRWPPHRTFWFVVVFNALAWTGIISSLATLL